MNNNYPIPPKGKESPIKASDSYKSDHETIDEIYSLIGKAMDLLSENKFHEVSEIIEKIKKLYNQFDAKYAVDKHRIYEEIREIEKFLKNRMDDYGEPFSIYDDSNIIHEPNEPDKEERDEQKIINEIYTLINEIISLLVTENLDKASEVISRAKKLYEKLDAKHLVDKHRIYEELSELEKITKLRTEANVSITK